MQCLDYLPLHQDALPPKITNKKKSDHNCLYPSDRLHKNVPVKIANLLVNTFST